MNYLGRFDVGTIESARLFAAIASVFLWFKVLDWLRLFDSTAFFIFLILSTIRGIGYFLIIMLISYMMFGTAFYMLNMNRSKDNAVMDELVPWVWPINVFQNQYELSLGEFRIDKFVEGPNAAWCYILFCLATLLIQIIFLNMLIAIMGDSFSQAIEEKELKGRLEKLHIMSDYTHLIKDVKLGEEER